MPGHEPGPTRHPYIERLADRLLADAQVTSAPVPVEEIAESRGCTIVPASLDDVSGILVRSAEGATSGVNLRHSQTRRRFTIAHELGHLLLHRGQEVRYDHSFRYSLRSGTSSTGTDVEEIEANFFAARPGPGRPGPICNPASTRAGSCSSTKPGPARP